mmetsp:Transcript_7632/g.22571  ORF Transcript_7632/g.22571 Transcript_7632/m.22571 type:complete len:346 (-) Transcript_7632:5825-6862(-)
MPVKPPWTKQRALQLLLTPQAHLPLPHRLPPLRLHQPLQRFLLTNLSSLQQQLQQRTQQFPPPHSHSQGRSSPLPLLRWRRQLPQLQQEGREPEHLSRHRCGVARRPPLLQPLLPSPRGHRQASKEGPTALRHPPRSRAPPSLPPPHLGSERPSGRLSVHTPPPPPLATAPSVAGAWAMVVLVVGHSAAMDSAAVRSRAARSAAGTVRCWQIRGRTAGRECSLRRRQRCSTPCPSSSTRNKTTLGPLQRCPVGLPTHSSVSLCQPVSQLLSFSPQMPVSTLPSPSLCHHPSVDQPPSVRRRLSVRWLSARRHRSSHRLVIPGGLKGLFWLLALRAAPFTYQQPCN